MLARVSAVYQIKNIRTGKVYVGSSVHVYRRWNEHRKMLNFGDHHSCVLQAAWADDGEEWFSFKILEVVDDPVELRVREKHWIKTMNSVRNGYNRIYDTEYKQVRVVKTIIVDERGHVVFKRLSRRDKKEYQEVGPSVFLRQLRVRGYILRFVKQKVKKNKKVRSIMKNSAIRKPGGCAVWKTDAKPYIIRA